MNSHHSAIEISAVIPAYNEGNRIRETLLEYCRFLNTQKRTFELLVILNGCTDNTRHVVDEVRQEFPQVRYKLYPEKLGKGGAIIEGFKYARGQLIVHTDADGSTSVQEIMRLIENMGDFDVIIGSRWMSDSEVPVRQSFSRRIASRGFNILTRLILGLSFKDTQCGAKVYRHHVIRNIVYSLYTSDYAIDACILFQAQRHGYKIKEFAIHWTDQKESKVSILRHAPGMIFSIILTRIGHFFERVRPDREEPDVDYWKEIEVRPFYTIVIPCRELDEYARDCIERCGNLRYDHYEIIVLPDKDGGAHTYSDSRHIRILPTGPVKPSIKRNVAVEAARRETEIIAFIDSDAYPDQFWLENSLQYFTNENVAAIGGPNLTPQDDTVLQKAGGDIFSIPIAIGQFTLRYQARYDFRKRQTVKEMPSCNLMVRKNIFTQIGGFDATLLTAEDSKLCFEIKTLGKKIIYAPDLRVYHHRRPLFLPHLRQVWTYGRDKMWVIKEDFSWDKLYYFIPLCFVLFLIFGIILVAGKHPHAPCVVKLLIVYGMIVAVAGLMKNVKRCLLIIPGIVLSHISYGLGSLSGLMTRRKVQ